jgi:hypothetical protein
MCFLSKAVEVLSTHHDTHTNTHTDTVSEVLSEASTCTIHLQVKHGNTKLLKTKDSHCQAANCSE